MDVMILCFGSFFYIHFIFRLFWILLSASHEKTNEKGTDHLKHLIV